MADAPKVSTHYDPVEANAICHDECAIGEIKRLRERVAAAIAYAEACDECLRLLMKAYEAAPGMPPEETGWVDALHAIGMNLGLWDVARANFRIAQEIDARAHLAGAQHG